MRVLEAVHILKDARVVGLKSKHGGQEGDDVCGFEAAAAVLEAVKEVAKRDLVIKGWLFLEGGNSRLLNDGFDECAPGAFDGFDEPLKLELGGLEALGLGADGVGRVGGDAVVIRL